MAKLLTTHEQNFYRELILKEAYARLAWKMKYGDEYQNTFSPRRSRSIETFNPPPADKLTLPPVVHKRETQRGPRAQQQVRRSHSDVPLMRPVSPQSSGDLYQGISNEGKGRLLYLRKRAQKSPQDKFEYPILSSWVYGWRLGDIPTDSRTLGNGRSGIVRNTFYAKNGIFNIPAATDQLG